MKQKLNEDLLKKEAIFWRMVKEAAKADPYRICRK
jgi:hypothetical protein